MAQAHVINADLIAYLRGNRWLAQNGFIPKAHAIVCDPPYGLEFMGKEWDKPKPSGLMRNRSGNFPSCRGDNLKIDKYAAGNDFQAWVTEWAELLLDYVHPGAVGMFFGGTRTYHRLAAGLEDAGWEIADSIVWCYGSGFPKSANIGKLIDKEAGAVREAVGIIPDRWAGKGAVLQRSTQAERESAFITAPATPLAARWEGHGTALKPAYEPVVICRAPRGKRTYAALAREFGTGALAVDAGRIGTDIIHSNGEGAGGLQRQAHAHGIRPYVDGLPHVPTPSEHVGRWPANFALVCECDSDDHADGCPVRVLGEQSGETVSSDAIIKRAGGFARGLEQRDDRPAIIPDGRGHADAGTAARFFYTAKAATWEREAGLDEREKRNVNDGRHTPIDNAYQRGDTLRLNVHPTVKPIRIAEYLARLALPPAGDEPRRLLIPFAGSGSEMIGAALAGWDVITGIERETEYADIARARLAWWSKHSSYEAARKAYSARRKTADDAQIALPMELP